MADRKKANREKLCEKATRVRVKRGNRKSLR